MDNQRLIDAPNDVSAKLGVISEMVDDALMAAGDRPESIRFLALVIDELHSILEGIALDPRGLQVKLDDTPEPPVLRDQPGLLHLP